MKHDLFNALAGADRVILSNSGHKPVYEYEIINGLPGKGPVELKFVVSGNSTPKGAELERIIAFPTQDFEPEENGSFTAYDVNGQLFALQLEQLTPITRTELEKRSSIIERNKGLMKYGAAFTKHLFRDETARHQEEP